MLSSFMLLVRRSAQACTHIMGLEVTAGNRIHLGHSEPDFQRWGLAGAHRKGPAVRAGQLPAPRKVPPAPEARALTVSFTASDSSPKSGCW